MNVFEQTDFREIIRQCVDHKRFNSLGRKKSNLSRIAGDLGYSSRSLLSMVLAGKRTPSLEFCEKLAETWKFSKREREYFLLLVDIERKRKQGKDISRLSEELRKFSKARNVHLYSKREFSILRNWYYMVIRELVGSPKFREDGAWISRTLARKVSKEQAERALQELEEAGHLARDAATGRLVQRDQLTETTDGILSADIKLHHRQMIARSLEAIDERPIDDRASHALAFRVDRDRLPDLRRQVREFVRTINAEYSSESSDSVFQLNLHFFEHTVKTATGGEGEQT